MRVRESSCYIKITHKKLMHDVDWRRIISSVFFSSTRFLTVKVLKISHGSTCQQYGNELHISLNQWLPDQWIRLEGPTSPSASQHRTSLWGFMKNIKHQEKVWTLQKWGTALQLQQHRSPSSILEEGKYYLEVCKQEVPLTLSEIINNVLSPFHVHERIKNLAEFRHYLQ